MLQAPRARSKADKLGYRAAVAPLLNPSGLRKTDLLLLRASFDILEWSCFVTGPELLILLLYPPNVWGVLVQKGLISVPR